MNEKIEKLLKYLPDENLKKDILDIFDSMPENIKSFWNQTQELLRNSIMVPGFMEKIVEDSYFALTQINPLHPLAARSLNTDYIVLIQLNRSAFIWSDCAHEVAHSFVLARLNYCYPWQIQPTPKGKYKLHNLIANIYDVAIHPVIDKLLKDKGLFSNEFYERKFKDVLGRLETVTKENLEICSIIFIVDSKHRLPNEMFNKIIESAKERNLHDMLALAQSLPIYDFDYNDPFALKTAIIETFKFFNIDYFKEGIRLYEKENLPFI